MKFKDKHLRKIARQGRRAQRRGNRAVRRHEGKQAGSGWNCLPIVIGFIGALAGTIVVIVKL